MRFMNNDAIPAAAPAILYALKPPQFPQIAQIIFGGSTTLWSAWGQTGVQLNEFFT